MAKIRKKDKDTLKWKKKNWYPIVAPKVFNSQPLGQTTCFEPSKVLGKVIRVNLMNLTGEVRNQNVNIKLKITSMNDNQAQTEVVGYFLSPAFIKRVVRRKHTRVDDTFTLKTKDGKELIIKPLLITRNKTNRNEVTALRTSVQENLVKIAGTFNYDDLIRNMVFYRLQLDMRKKLSKIYPLKTFDIKMMNLVEKVNE